MFSYGKDDFLFFSYARITVMRFATKEKTSITCFIVISYNLTKYVVYLDIKTTSKLSIFIS